ncbi:hypothetical protein SLE2022_019290 [Rubroshorea leprosula]
MLPQKIVIKVSMHCDKCRTKAMKIAAVAHDRFTDHDLSLSVTSVAFHGEDRDRLLIERDGVDAACLTISLRKKSCHATLATVEEIKPKEENKDGDENMRTSIEMRDEPQGILTTFTSIDLSKNKFGGEIPELIGKLSYLKGHNLSHNNLTRPISPSLGNLKNLEWLDLSSNALVGKIPDELTPVIVGSRVHLRSLSEQNNDLGGDEDEVLGVGLESLKILLKWGVFLGLMIRGFFGFLVQEGACGGGSGECRPDVIERLPRGSSDTAIEIIDGNFSWDLSTPKCNFERYKFESAPWYEGCCLWYCWLWQVKFTCILGEITKISGTLKLCVTKAYVAQSPWIQSGKIEENILFGKEMDMERYEMVLEACSLKKDLEILSFGDQTVIVDAHTGSHLFKEVRLSMLSSKIVIFVTHQVESLPAADLILVMKDREITQAGKYNDILSSGTDFIELVGAHKKALSALDSVEAGSLSAGVLQIGSNYWMAWTTPVSEDVMPLVEASTLIMVYVALAISSSFCVFARAMLLNTAGYKTATLLFNKMHHCIFRALMSFFDATPSGHILNRASTDQSTVDLNVPNQVGALAFSMIQLLGIIAVMSQAARQVFFVFIPVIATSVWYQQYYISSARELARLVGVCKAPVIQKFSETISEATTTRSFDEEPRIREKTMKLSYSFSRPVFHTAGAIEWLCFRLDMLSSITFAFSLVFLISIPPGIIDAGIAGLAVTYGLNLNMLQAMVIWSLCNLENKIISVERIIQYSNIPSEPPLVIETNRPAHSWPSLGKIDIHDLQVRYAPHMPLVLWSLTCTFPGGLKTGIVGRTGSGKSTLIQTLFRIVEPAAGQIIIDGVNISSIGLHDLRSRLSIISQDPTMFEGTVRSNLDPLEEYTDEQIWEALDKCQLGDEVRKKEGKLDSTVSENGENWSVDQRQLVCLGRVLLKKTKVLVLDEATASVDTATDNLIQQTLREHFSDCTVLTIAHRITSVLDSDMVLLLNHGLIEEYNSPARLLENKSSSFAQLVAEYTTRSNSSFDH